MSTKPISVLHVIDVAARSYGGSASVVHALCNGLVKYGCSASVLSGNCDWPKGFLDCESDRLFGNRLYPIHLCEVTFRPMVYSNKFNQYFHRNRGRYDLFHIHNLYRYPQCAAAIYARRNNIPYVITPHGSLTNFQFHKDERKTAKRIYEFMFERKNIRRASAIHFTAEDEKREALENFLVPRSRTAIIPNHIDTDRFAVLPKKGFFRKKIGLADEKFILFSGRIAEKKGIPLLLEAIGRLKETGHPVRLILVGPDNENLWDSYRRIVVSLGIQNEVKYIGMLSEKDLLNAYVDSTVLVLPSFSENFGLVVAEAMLSMKPVIISNNVGICRDVESAGAGIVVNCNSESITGALIKILGNDDLAQKMGNRGRDFVMSHYSEKAVIEQFMQLYCSVLKGPVL